MGIFLPEKILTGILAVGLTTVKADPSVYLNDVFDSDELGAPFVQTAIDYLTGQKVKISQGYPLDDQRLPGWFIVPATSQDSQNFIGGYGADEDSDYGVDGEGDPIPGAGEISVKMNSYSVKIISASMNGDVTLMLDAVCRYILLLARDQLSDYNMNEITINTTDYDPVYQFLPQEFQLRSTIISFQGVDTWIKRFPLIKDALLFVKFNPTENYIEIE